MAYPTVSAAYGFKPINRLDGLPYAGATRQFPIAYNYNTSIFYGDLVDISSGVVVRSAITSATTTSAVAGTIGVFMGCTYTNPSTGQRLWAQYYPANTLAQDISAFVVDDPKAVFKVAVISQSGSVSNTATAIGYASPAVVGSNVYAVTGTAGSTTTGDGKSGVSGDNPTNGSGLKVVTTALPFRVVAVVPETALTVTASGTSSSTTVTLSAADSSIKAGMQFVVAGVANAGAGDYNLVTNVNGTTVTISKAVTISSAATLTFVGYPEVIVKWNQGYHSYENSTGA